MPLTDTYSQSTIHDDWRTVYRRDPRQLAFDDAVYEWLFERIQPQGAWLDAGCGSGEHTFRLARHCSKVVAVDISDVIIAAARTAAEQRGLADRIEFVSSPLEELSAPQGVQNVHCRGVMMHIPDWRTVLENLCRNVKPGGYLVLCEEDRRSLEAYAVQMVRKVRNSKSRMDQTEGGLEFWSDTNGTPFLARMADLDKVESELRRHGLEPLLRRSIFVIDLNRLPASCRGFGIRVNQLWFKLGLPKGCGVLLVARRPA